jgi:hypothetical protein
MQLGAVYSTLLPSRPGGVFLGVTEQLPSQPAVSVHVVLGAPGYNDAATVNPRILRDSAPPMAGCDGCNPYLVAPAFDYYKSYLWVARSDAYAIQLYRGWGLTHAQTLRVHGATWFTDVNARLTGLQQWNGDVLLVSGVLGDSANAVTVVDVIGLDAVEDRGTRVVRSARVLARARFEGRFHFTTPGYGYVNRRDANGDWVVDVYRMNLLR